MTSLTPESKTALRRLEIKVDALLLLCQRLQEENETLNALLQGWVSERAEFSQQTAIAKKRVETMITRLKSMEPNT